jgi:hypothetical protein
MASDFVNDLPQLQASEIAEILRSSSPLTADELRAVLAEAFDRISVHDDIHRRF